MEEKVLKVFENEDLLSSSGNYLELKLFELSEKSKKEIKKKIEKRLKKNGIKNYKVENLNGLLISFYLVKK